MLLDSEIALKFIFIQTHYRNRMTSAAPAWSSGNQFAFYAAPAKRAAPSCIIFILRQKGSAVSDAGGALALDALSTVLSTGGKILVYLGAN